MATFGLNYGLWALLTPGIFWFSRRLPIEQQRWRRMIGVLFVLGLLVSLLHSALFEAITQLANLSVERNFSLSHLLFDHVLPILPIKFLIFCAILGAGYAFDYYKRNREHISRMDALEKQLLQAKLEALKSQLQPHFLFNILHAVSALVENDPAAARHMLARLSELLRLTLESEAKHEITLDTELALLESYLEIEKVRFQDRLKLELAISEEARSALLPNMILQPLVENAIRHGVTKRRSGGSIKITAVCENGLLRIEVQDDGPGLSQQSRDWADSGVGLKNTRSRLEQLYGDRQTFDVIDLNGQGLKIRFAIPYHEKPVGVIPKNIEE